MAYDEQLASRVRDVLSGRTDFEEKKMFGGLAFMVNTHMACGLMSQGLMVRVGKEGYDDALGRGAQPLHMGERVMGGMVLAPGGLDITEPVLQEWVDIAVDFAKADPPKRPKTAKKKA